MRHRCPSGTPLLFQRRTLVTISTVSVSTPKLPAVNDVNKQQSPRQRRPTCRRIFVERKDVNAHSFDTQRARLLQTADFLGGRCGGLLEEELDVLASMRWLAVPVVGRGRSPLSRRRNNSLAHASAPSVERRSPSPCRVGRRCLCGLSFRNIRRRRRCTNMRQA